MNAQKMILYFPGWKSLLLFVKNSILNGSKEVALAAINCLQTTVNSHSSKVITKLSIISQNIFNLKIR